MQEHAYVLNLGVGHGPECTGLEKIMTLSNLLYIQTGTLAPAV